MAVFKTAKVKVNRYPGVDSQPWIVKDTSGKKINSESFASFTEADNAARQYTDATGTFAQANRA